MIGSSARMMSSVNVDGRENGRRDAWVMEGDFIPTRGGGPLGIFA
jgi:hypothetical protein